MKSMKKKTFDSKVKREAAYLLDACLKTHASRHAKDRNTYLVDTRTRFRVVATEAIAQTSTALLLLGIKNTPHIYASDAIALHAA